MKLSQLLKLQLLYCLGAMGYNAVSLYLIATAKPPLTPTSPMMGLLAMALYGLFLIPGHRRIIRVYRILMAIAVIVLGYGGVVSHVLNMFARPELYASFLAWFLAVGINLFGLILNLVAVSGKFKA